MGHPIVFRLLLAVAGSQIFQDLMTLPVLGTLIRHFVGFSISVWGVCVRVGVWLDWSCGLEKEDDRANVILITSYGEYMPPAGHRTISAGLGHLAKEVPVSPHGAPLSASLPHTLHPLKGNHSVRPTLRVGTQGRRLTSFTCHFPQKVVSPLPFITLLSHFFK
jgi:hypothetical protein